MSIFVIAEDVNVQFPIYNAPHRSLKKAVLRAATGGRIGADPGGRICVQALDGISFHLREGDRIGLVGANGSGKTTLLRVIAGAYEPVSGRLRVNGRVASLLDISIGMEPEATGYDNILLRGLMMGLKPREIRAKTEEIADFSGLGDYLEVPLRTYSSGMVMRLAFSVSTTIEPDILVMDEWLSVGDAAFVQRAEERLKQLIDRTPILMLASHSVDLIKKLCTETFTLENGRLVTQTKVTKLQRVEHG